LCVFAKNWKKQKQKEEREERGKKKKKDNAPVRGDSLIKGTSMKEKIERERRGSIFFFFF